MLHDRIEIVSHPGADRSITDEGLKTYRVFNRRYRNRRIGKFLKEMHLTEGRNTGFRKILNALEMNGSPKPVFETDPNSLSFSSTIFIHPAFVGENVGINVGIKLNSTQKKIVDLLKNNPDFNLDDIARSIGVQRRTVERNLKMMKDNGIIERSGQNKTGYWIVRK